MKIAVSAMNPNLEAQIDPRFGRCRYFIIVDAETMQFEAIENSSAMASGGAGISAAQTIVGKGTQAVLTGNCGPNAFEVLAAAGIEVVTGVAGTVQEAVRDYKAGKYQTSSQPNAAANSGAGQGRRRGKGRGMGR